MDKRIGTRHRDEIAWPETTISGREYTRPSTTLDLDRTHFVVLDTGIVADENARNQEIEKLRGQVEKTQAAERQEREQMRVEVEPAESDVKRG